jgi:hypothetical protein
MNLNDFLNTEVMNLALGDFAYASPSGSLLTASQLLEALNAVFTDNPCELDILRELAAHSAGLTPDRVVAKVYADDNYGDLRVIGIKAGIENGEFVIFGNPIPSTVTSSIVTVDAGKAGEQYKRTELKLSKIFKDADGDDAPVDLSFQLIMPSSIKSDDYRPWLESLIGKTKKALLNSDLIGQWREPGLGNPSLLQLAEQAVENGGYAVYKVTGWTQKERNKKDGSGTWISYGLKLEGPQGAIETDQWIIPRSFGFSDMMRRTINKGSQTFYLHLYGTVQQITQDGDLMTDSEGNPFLEAIGKINTSPNFPPKHKQATIAPKAQTQMRSASPEYEIVEPAEKGALAFAGDW